MSLNEKIQQDILAIGKMVKNSNAFEPFIRKVVFSNFKNIDSMNELIIDFPITALVGKNGTNKTSALIALYGSVEKKTPFDYWFTTPIDKTSEAYQSYWYSYKAENNIMAEVLLVNNQRKDRNDPNRWETAKPKKSLGMNTDIQNALSSYKTRSRWMKIRKDVVYINFRSEISAFDRCFYHDRLASRYLNKQSYIRAKSKYLKKAIDEKLQEYVLYKKNRVFCNIILDDTEVKIISNILGKKYTSIKYIEHQFFDVYGGTAILQTDSLNYSEAFAGSGEFAVVSLVHKVFTASDNSLILLDEPEVSLHPNAQKRLMAFLLGEIKNKKHQIVLSTHSSEIISLLPSEAIKLFYINEKNKINISNNTDPINAFMEIGHETDKIPVYVEDKLAVSILNYIINNCDELKGIFDVRCLPGGAESIFQRFSIFSEVNSKQLIILDGDKRTQYYKDNKRFPLVTNIPEIDLENNIRHITSEKIKFYSNGNSGVSDNENKNKLIKKFIEDSNKYITFFMFDVPEVFILSKNNVSECDKAEMAKEYFKRLTEDKGFGCDSERILHCQEDLLSNININETLELEDIKNKLYYFKANWTLLGYDYGVNYYEKKNKGF